MAEATIWGIHAGATGDAETLFLKKNHVAIGWDPMGTLAAIPPNREAFKAEVARVYPERKLRRGSPARPPTSPGNCTGSSTR